MANGRWLIVKNRRTIILRYLLRHLLRQGYGGLEGYEGQVDDRPPENGEARTRDEKSIKPKDEGRGFKLKGKSKKVKGKRLRCLLH